MSGSSDPRFEAVDLTGWLLDRDEPSGENEKTWFRDPESPDRRWIYKPNRENRSEHEDRSELVASILAQQFGIPSADVRLGYLKGSRGCLSRNIVSNEDNELEHASLYLSEFVENFDPRAKGSTGHSEHWIRTILEQLEPPIAAPVEGLRAVDWFAGYLIFDALIGNTDRHSENWAIEITPKGTMHLAPSYDHATSLGVTTRGPRLARVLSSEALLKQFAMKATAYRFEGHTKTSLVDFAAHFLEGCGPDAQRYWRESVLQFEVGVANRIIEQSKMSAEATRLAAKIVSINKERLVSCLGC
ncbi:HipA domain-containing protein [Arthrobacter sp. MMS18-M83]|uniref:HipA domain-containing protein n=1 Tax=Arthrobacter sp. MMS18-M83 TaxID=2996261 RepID=UPI00227C550E|nr:HipA domain-containing protein [Arthrobacter sp. MMS18-M83]WAH97520.1 HipA domain-containing protein [Arthrobacter sp. MMS18-M83]